MKKQNIKKSDIIIDVIDKINLMKVDISFISNLLTAWNIDQVELTHNDMFGMSRVCDSINIQLNECQDLVNLFNQKQEKLN
jgi:nitrate reductase beta subunit